MMTMTRTTAKHRSTPGPCSCGGLYCALRTGMTYREVRQIMDPDRWKGRRRSSVLGYWRQIKLQLWDSVHQACE
jgi:hypothetical protein